MKLAYQQPSLVTYLYCYQFKKKLDRVELAFEVSAQSYQRNGIFSQMANQNFLWLDSACNWF